jgi:hypothetical protein
MKALNANPEFQEANRERMKALYANPEFQEAHRERGREQMKALHANPEFQEAHRRRAIKICESHRKNAYFVDKRFYASSQQEGAVALLLEKYIPGYLVKEGETFQVRDKGINNGGIDFLVGNEFLEWHPVVLYSDSRRRGDIPAGEYEHYKSVLELLCEEGEEAEKEFKKDYSRVLAVNYRNKRQESVNRSGHNGKNVSLAGDVDELYNFIARYSVNLPSDVEFAKEFAEKVKYVKTCNIKPAA